MCIITVTENGFIYFILLCTCFVMVLARFTSSSRIVGFHMARDKKI